MIKILLVEDDMNLCEIISDYFTEKSDGNIHIVCAENGDICDCLLYENTFDLIMLDVMLPDTEGFTICRNIRENSDVPIIFITARHTEADILFGYSLGCDDYISKPFSLAQLFAKVQALIKRSKGIVKENFTELGGISLDAYRCKVYSDKKEVYLAPKEYAILKLLMDNHDKIVSRETILIKIWGYDYAGNDRAVDDHIRKLRKSLGASGRQIKTVFKRGYKITER